MIDSKAGNPYPLLARMKPAGIYLYGYYGQGNLGDDLLMKAAIEAIHHARPEAEIWVHCQDVARLPDQGPARLRPVTAGAALADATLSKPARLKRHFSMLRYAFDHCEALVFGGGTVLQESHSPVSIMLIAAMCWLARRKGLKIILLGAGLGEPRTIWGRIAARSVLERAKVAALRDSRSVALARHLVPGAAVEETADLVFSMHGMTGLKPARRGDAVALSIQPSLTNRTDATGAEARALLADTAYKALQAGRSVKLLVFETKGASGIGVDDAAAWRALFGQQLDDASSGIALVSANAREPGRLFDDVAVHAGMRFHGHVLAVLAGLPFVGLSHDIKITEICRTLDMPCLPIEEASSDSFWAAIQTAEGRAVSADALNDLAARSARNRDLLEIALR